jgi:hypothetical protein
MCIDVGNAENAMQVVESQVRFILDQEKKDFPARVLSVRCGCLKKVKLKYAYRCLYCSVFFCKECAEDHFGKTIDQYRDENPLHT